MVDIIIIIIVILLLLLALKGTIKHFKGEGPCCGGGSGSIDAGEKKLTNPIMGQKTIHIAGMHCDHCVQSVTQAINQIEGASAKVSLKNETAIVSYDRTIADTALQKAVEQAGFQVISIEA